MNFEEVTRWLDALIAGTTQASRTPGTVGVVLQIVSAALRFAVDLARQGLDPIAHIERIHAADKRLSEVEGSWAQKLHEKFGMQSPSV